MKRLGDLFSQRQEPGIPGLPVMSVTMNDSLVLRAEIDRRLESALRPEQHLLVRKGDIAYNMMRMWQGACGLATSDGIVSPAYVVLAPKPGIDSRFAYHWFKSDRMIYLFWAYSHGLTEDRLRLYFDAFAEIPASPPFLEQQRRIALVLDTWDLAIAQMEDLIVAKRRQLSALLGRLILTRCSAAGRKDIRQIKLKNLGKVVRGVSYDPISDVLTNGDAVAILTAANVQHGQVHLLGGETRVTRSRVKPEQFVRKEDFVLCMSNGSRNLVGKAGLASEALSRTSAPGAFCAIFRPKDYISGLIASMLFQSEGYREQLHIALAGSAINNLVNSELQEFTFHVSPSLKDSDPAFFRTVSNDLLTACSALGKRRAEKRGLMQKLFGSGWRLDEPFDAPAFTSSPALTGRAI